ncbi:hypothetical protein ACLMMR_42530, partial [Streptomyces sp. NPDC000405]
MQLEAGVALPGESGCLQRHGAARRAYRAWAVDGLPRAPLTEAGSTGRPGCGRGRRPNPVLTWGPSGQCGLPDPARIACRRLCPGGVARPADPAALILHHDSCTMTDRAPWCRAVTGTERAGSGGDQGIPRLVHTSTSETYGTARTVPITEDHPINT